MHNELHSQKKKKHRGEVITQRATHTTPPHGPAFFLFVGACMCDGRAAEVSHLSCLVRKQTGQTGRAEGGGVARGWGGGTTRLSPHGQQVLTHFWT